MALNKVNYVDGQTVITAENLNDIQDAIIALENAPAQGLTEDMKQALLQIARKVAYIDDQGQTYYDDLYDAFYPPKTVVLITAVFEQGSTVIYDDTALNDLKQYLTVTAKYDDNTTAILPDGAYTLSGLLEAGTSTVTVAYNGLTTTFTVNVTARPTLSSISAVYTQSGTVYDTDTLDSLKADLVVTAIYSDSSTETVPAADYTLSGTLTAGISTITVSYGGKTASFDVTVTKYWDVEWDYTMGSPVGRGFEHTNDNLGTLTENGYLMSGASATGCNLRLTTGGDISGEMSKGVTELVFRLTAVRNNWVGFHFDVKNFWFYIANNYSGYKTYYQNVPSTPSVANTTEFGTFELNRDYKIRGEWDINSGATLYVDDVVAYQITGALNGTNRIRWGLFVDNNETALLVKSIKVKEVEA